MAVGCFNLQRDALTEKEVVGQHVQTTCHRCMCNLESRPIAGVLPKDKRCDRNSIPPFCSLTSTMSLSDDGLERRFQQRAAMGTSALETKPIASVAQASRGNIPNTPLASSLIAFCLGITFTAGSLLVALGGIQGSVVFTTQLGFFVASWAIFHWLEFAVTAGWNREKCSVDCKHRVEGVHAPAKPTYSISSRQWGTVSCCERHSYCGICPNGALETFSEVISLYY